MADVELMELIRERFRPKKNKFEDEQRRVAVVAELQDILAEHLKDPDTSLTVEVPTNLLAEFIDAIDNVVLSSQYRIVQLADKNLFKITMKSLDL